MDNVLILFEFRYKTIFQFFVHDRLVLALLLVDIFICLLQGYAKYLEKRRRTKDEGLKIMNSEFGIMHFL